MKSQENAKRKRERMFIVTLKRLKKNRLAMLGLIVIVILALLAILAPLISPYPYTKADFKNKLQGPSQAHWFGTDELGRDILSRLLYGARYSLSIGILGVLISAGGGILMGSIAGFFGGMVDNVIMRLMDVLQAMPGILLAIAISAALGPGLTNCVIALSIGSIPGYARMTRASILNVRKMEYLEAATSINCSNTRIIIRHVLPNSLSPLIVQSTMGIAGVIMGAAMLSFIGLGVQPPMPEWGAMLSAGRNYLRDYPHLCIFPGVTIMMTVLSLNMLGDGLRDALDPKLKS